MARKPKAPKPIPPSTLKAVAACHALGLIYHGGTGALLAAVDDRQGYHFVRVRTSAGVTSAAHVCRSQRSSLASKLTTTAQCLAGAERFAPHRVPEWSREYTRVELALVNPSWLCDVDSEFIESPGTDGIMAAAGLDFTVEVDEC